MQNIARDYKRFLQDDLWRSFFTVWSLRNFAFGLIAVYSPIYFYSKGYGLGFIFLFLAVQAFANGLMRLPYTYYIARKHDVRISFAASIVALGLVYVGYALLIHNKPALLVIAVLDGILQCALWSCYHYVFSAAQHHKRIGSQVGVMYDGSYLSAIIAIGIGGYIGQTIGLAFNFIIASMVLAVAAFMALRLKITWPHHPVNIKKEKVNLTHTWREAVAGSANMIDASVVAIIWPLLFVVFGILSFTQVGIVVAASLAIVLLLNLVFGEIADDVDRAKAMLDIGIMGTILIYMLRIISIGSRTGAITLMILGQITRGAVDVSYSVLFYRRLNKSSSKIKFIAVYESLTGYALAAYFLILCLVKYAGATDQLTLVLAFVIAAALIPLTRLIAPDSFKELK